MTPPTDATRTLRELIAEWRKTKDFGRTLADRLESIAAALESELAAREAQRERELLEAAIAEAKWWRYEIDPLWLHEVSEEEGDCNCLWCHRIADLRAKLAALVKP